MNKNKQVYPIDNQEYKLLSAMLSPEELSVLPYLKSFDRKKTMQWQEDGLWDDAFD